MLIDNVNLNGYISALITMNQKEMFKVGKEEFDKGQWQVLIQMVSTQTEPRCWSFFGPVGNFCQEEEAQDLPKGQHLTLKLSCKWIYFCSLNLKVEVFCCCYFVKMVVLLPFTPWIFISNLLCITLNVNGGSGGRRKKISETNIYKHTHRHIYIVSH